MEYIGPRRHVGLAVNAAGKGVGVWEAPDGVASGIWGRPFDNGVLAPTEGRINLLDELIEREPSAAIDERGGIFVTWVRAVGALDGAVPESPFGSPIVIKGRKSGGGGFAFGGTPRTRQALARAGAFR